MKISKSSYIIEIKDSHILAVKFGVPAKNNQIVKDAQARLNELIESNSLTGGSIIKINGPLSNPVAMVLSHKLAHLYQTVACFDPKLAKYVVVISHSDEYALGDLID